VNSAKYQNHKIYQNLPFLQSQEYNDFGVDILHVDRTHSGVWGSNLQDFTKQVKSRKALCLEVDKIIIIKIKWNAQDKGMILIGFLSYRSHGVTCETGL
jgi:hypothetical protein